MPGVAEGKELVGIITDRNLSAKEKVDSLLGADLNDNNYDVSIGREALLDRLADWGVVVDQENPSPSSIEYAPELKVPAIHHSTTPILRICDHTVLSCLKLSLSSTLSSLSSSS